MELGDLTLATFEPAIGDRFTIAGGAHGSESIELVLESATKRADWPGCRDPFSLIFRGPPKPLLPQAIYPLAHAALGVLEIFVVPIARDAESIGYQAIFT